jgi:hypothetical protein
MYCNLKGRETMFENADVIASHGPLRAIEDGDLTWARDLATSAHPAGIAREAGYGHRVALTSGVVDLVTPTGEELSRGQSIAGRLWDVLIMGNHPMIPQLKRPTGRAVTDAQANGAGSCLYKVSFACAGRQGRPAGSQEIVLKLGLSCDENHEPLFTIGLPSED